MIIPTTLAPLLSVRDGKAALSFYQAAFAASEVFCLEDNGSIVARLAIGESEFWMADESPEHLNFSPPSLNGSTARMILTVADPDTVFDHAIAAGATIIHPVEDQPYGWRVGRLADPFGHHWEIGKPIR